MNEAESQTKAEAMAIRICQILELGCWPSRITKLTGPELNLPSLLIAEAERDAAAKALDGRIGCMEGISSIVYACEQYIGAEDALPEWCDAEDYSLSSAVERIVARFKELEKESEERDNLAPLGETHQAADKLVTERTLEASKLRAELTKLKPNQGDSLIAAIEGNDAGMSHADLVLTVKMLRRGRSTWRKEAEQAQAELATVRAELQRMTDLVRYQRAELHETGLINDDEYAQLCGIEGSRVRLETYDQLKATNTALMAVARVARLLLNGPILTTSYAIKLREDWQLALTALEAQGVKLEGEL